MYSYHPHSYHSCCLVNPLPLAIFTFYGLPIPSLPSVSSFRFFLPSCRPFSPASPLTTPDAKRHRFLSFFFSLLFLTFACPGQRRRRVRSRVLGASISNYDASKSTAISPHPPYITRQSYPKTDIQDQRPRPAFTTHSQFKSTASFGYVASVFICISIPIFLFFDSPSVLSSV